MIEDPLKKIEEVAKDTNKFMENKTKGVFSRYPLTFSFLVLFGVIAVLHGFEEILNQIPFFEEHPIVVFLGGIFTLILTGSLYKRLEKKIEY